MNAKHKEPADVVTFAHAVANHQGYAVNPAKDFVATLALGLAANYNRYGYYLCPCRDADGDRSADADIICPCDYNLPDQKEYGHCFCGLFMTEEFAASNKEPASIPERRPGGI